MTDSPRQAVPDIRVTSTRNERVKAARKLSMKKYRQKQGLILVEGIRTVEMAATVGLGFDALFCVAEVLDEYPHLVAMVRSLGGAIIEVTGEIIEAISTLASSPGVVGVAARPVWPRSEVLSRALDGDTSVLVWFDRVSDPSNLGAIIRSAHCLGADGYLASPGTVEIFNPRAIRSSAGSTFMLPGLENIDLAEMTNLLRPHGFILAATVPRGGVSLDQLQSTKRLVLMIGEEARGLSDDALEASGLGITIPMVEEAESLNVAAASAIILHHLSPVAPS